MKTSDSNAIVDLTNIEGSQLYRKSVLLHGLNIEKRNILQDKLTKFYKSQNAEVTNIDGLLKLDEFKSKLEGFVMSGDLLFGGLNVAIIRFADAARMKLVESAIKTLEGAESSNIIITVCDSLTKTSVIRKIYENAKKTVSIECTNYSNKELEKTIIESFQEYDITVQKNALEKMLAVYTQEQAGLKTDIDKLASLKNYEGEVTLQDIENLFSIEQDANVMKACDDILTCDLQFITGVINQVKTNQITPETLISLLPTKLNALDSLIAMTSKGMPIRDALFKAKVFGVDSKTLDLQVKNLTNKKISQIYKDLSNLEKTIRKYTTTLSNIKTLQFERFCLGLV